MNDRIEETEENINEVISKAIMSFKENIISYFIEVKEVLERIK